jgi:uncharacterized surface protein with fasciclin (FAS1) repeats
MFKLGLILAVLLLIAAPGEYAATAQANQTIPEVLAADPQGRFTVLTAALEAVGLTDRLSGQEQYTLLAPTDAAFDILASFLGVSRDQLLKQDADLLRPILLYHLLPGRVFFRQFTTGQPHATALDDAEISGALQNGWLIIDGARVIDVDNVAANGVIQVIDNVLIPPQTLSAAHLRVAHFSPDAPSLDIYLDGAISGMRELDFPSVTRWIELPGAIHSVAFVPSGQPLDQAVIVPSDFTLRPNSWTTLAAVGSVTNSTLIPVLIIEDADPIPPGEARITVLAAVEGVPPFDFLMRGGVFVSRLGYPFSLGDNDGYYTFDHRAGTYNTAIRNYGETAPLSAELLDVPITAGEHYLFALVGTADAPALIAAGDVR